MDDGQTKELEKHDPAAMADWEQPGAAALPRDLAIVKMENDNIMALAAAHPREPATMLADLKAQIEAYPSFAKKAMYTKPVGKDPKTGQMKFARGLSIRAAEAIAEVYKYNQCRIDVSPLGNDAARVETSFVDYQTGRVFKKSAVVSKNFKRRNGQMARHNDDRFYDVVCNGAGSRLLRECIVRSVSPGLRSELERCVDEQLDAFLDEATVKKILAQFANKDITQAHLEAIIGKRIDAFTRDDRATLLGMWNSLEQEEVTVPELLANIEADKPQTDADIRAQLSKPVEDVEAPKDISETVLHLRQGISEMLGSLPADIGDKVLYERELPGHTYLHCTDEVTLRWLLKTLQSHAQPPEPEPPKEPAKGKGIGAGSALYAQIINAFASLDGDTKVKICTQWKFKNPDELSKWDNKDANDLLTAINDELPATK